MKSEAKKYNRIKLQLGVVEELLSFFLLMLILALGISNSVYAYVEALSPNQYVRLILFVIIIGAVISLFTFPISFYSSYILEHKYNLSNQTLGSWIIDELKELAVGSAIGLPLLALFYWTLQLSPDYWWLIFASLMFFVSVILAQVFPIIIMPIFYKVIPVDNDSLKERITTLAGKVGLKVENVYTFDMSKNTKKANAAFTGLGKTKRIILGDTLLNNFSVDEIETVIAHELGHYKKKHIIKNLIISTISSFLFFYLINILDKLSLTWFGFTSITEIPALPLIAVWGIFIGFFTTPITNAISRKFEFEADEYAVKSTGKPEIFIKTLYKLNEQNLGDEMPNKFIEIYFYSHPSIKRRAERIRTISAEFFGDNP
jgi:STE24 endopeptidase